MTTLGTLLTTLRQRTDTTSATGYLPDAELVSYLNSSLADLYDKLVGTYEEYAVTLSGTLTITSAVDGSNYFSLPADFHKLRGVDRQFGGVWTAIDRYELPQRGAYGQPPWFRQTPIDARYHLLDSKIFVVPFASAPGSYRLWYVPTYTTLASGDTLPAIMDQNAWHEYAVVDSAIKVLAKQDLDPSTFMAQKGELSQRILDAAKPRDAGPPKRMVDTRCFGGFGGWPGSGWGGR